MAYKQTKKELIGEIFRFLLVGGLATIADYVVFLLIQRWLIARSVAVGDIGLSVSLGIATAIGFIVGLIINWILSVKFVYRAVRDKEEASSKKSFLVFTLIGACGLVISSIGVPALAFILPEIELFNRTMVFGILWKEWIARIALTCIVLIWNYIGRKIFIFKS